MQNIDRAILEIRNLNKNLEFANKQNAKLEIQSEFNVDHVKFDRLILGTDL